MDGGAAYPLRAVAAPSLPIAQMVIGTPVDAALELLPRIFNLCREAQATAARAAFGRPLPVGWEAALRAEILREHVAKLCLKWPALLGVPGIALPPGWQQKSALLSTALFGNDGCMPKDVGAFERWLSQPQGIAPTLNAWATAFAPGEAVRDALPAALPANLFNAAPKENSAAARHADHPVMQHIEARWGRGPFWSATGVAYDCAATMEGHLPKIWIADGRAAVPAARGLYGVSARIENGHVADFRRVTPTDHLLARGGMLAQALAGLSQENKEMRAALLLSAMDPCFPVSLQAAKEMTDA